MWEMIDAKLRVCNANLSTVRKSLTRPLKFKNFIENNGSMENNLKS